MHGMRVSLAVALGSALCIGVACGSDANLQEQVRELDRDEVLAKIAKMPIREADGVALLAIQALELRTRVEHEFMLADTQALADESSNLVRENAARAAEIAMLKAELAALRADVHALRRVRR
jgi:hypothetical protein